MPTMEEIELNRHPLDIVSDVKHLVEKYRRIFEWDIPDVRRRESDRLILKEIHSALADVESKLLC